MQYSGNSSKHRTNIEVLFLSETNERPNKKPLVEDTNPQDIQNINANEDETDWELSDEELEILEETNHGSEDYDYDDKNEYDIDLSDEEIELENEFSISNREYDEDDYYDPQNEKHRRIIGACLARRIAKIFEDLGFKTEWAKGQSNGMDIKVWLNNKIALVIEAKNYNMMSKIENKKIDEALANFRKYPDCTKYVVYSCMANENALRRFTKEGIKLLKLDYQLMPEKFYNSLNPSVRTHRRIDNESTSADIKARLYPIIHEVLTNNSNDVLLSTSI
jgi:hypothetical protein